MNGQEADNDKHWFDEMRHRDNKHRFISRFARMIYYRLIVPIKREKRGPQVIAWGVAIGLMVGFTPTVGFQMPLIALIWGAARLVNFHFSLFLAIAWSWLSNGVTMIPVYYMFYVTGTFILPSDGSEFSYDTFAEYIGTGITEDTSMAEALAFLGQMIGEIGGSIIIGCLPYSIGFAAIGYWFAMKAAKSYRQYKKSHE